jgi:hypothetical protein
LRNVLLALFATILVLMLAGTIWASLERNVFDAGGELLRNPWGVMTLADAVFGFVTFSVWVVYRERQVVRRTVWILAIFALGNIAMATYLLVALARMPAGSPLEELLLRRRDR